jgi:hypothetical protein
MGELKQLRDQQASLTERARQWGNTLYLAGLGAYSKTNDGSEALYQQYVERGTEAYGEQAEGRSKPVLAGRGLLVSARELLDDAPARRQRLYERCIRAGQQQRGDHAQDTNEFVLAGLGAVATLRQQGRQLFDELVSAGEKEST